MRRGNRHLVGVVLGGRSGGSRDAIMRNLLAENLEKASTTRTVAAITERSVSDANADVAEVDAESRPTQTVQVQGAVQGASAAPEPGAPPPARSNATAARSIFAAATASVPPAQSKAEPAPLTSGVIQSQAIAAIPGSSEPMKPVKVKTVQVKAGPLKLASAGPPQPTTPITSAIPPARPEVPETSNAVVAKAETSKPEAGKPEASKPETNRVEANRVDVPRTEMPPQPANHGTGNGVLGVLPASSVPASPPSQAMAYADPTPRPQPQPVQQSGAIKPVAAHTGWIVQVGALESESEALLRIEAARNQARGLLAKADPFTEPVVAKGDRKLFRARFAGLDRDQAEAVCRTLKRSDISCITVRN
jgi:D-alanyl-D-alanine carboxypeptidase